MFMPSRREFLGAVTAAAGLACSPAGIARMASAAAPESSIAFGLVTYMWGADWDLPTLLKHCEATNTRGVELRTTHAHGVEPSLNDAQRQDVRRRFGDSSVALVGIGSNERFDNPDPAILKKAIDATKEFIRLSHDVGGTGVKVKPDTFHKDIPREKTIEQIARTLNEIGEYGEGFGQQIRLEVHGECQELPTIKAIMDIANHRNVAVCWNSNPADLAGEGLEHNFKLVRERFGETCHIHELNDPKYPYQQLIDLLVRSDYNGWLLLEAGSKPADRVAALAEQSKLLTAMLAKARTS